jgi:hypothetical protein
VGSAASAVAVEAFPVNAPVNDEHVSVVDDRSHRSVPAVENPISSAAFEKMPVFVSPEKLNDGAPAVPAGARTGVVTAPPV